MTTVTVLPHAAAAKTPALRPLPLWQAVVLFAVPAAALAWAVYWLWPALTSWGVPRLEARYYVSTLVMAGLVVAALAALAREGHPLTWPALSARFRLGRMDGRAWLWTLAGFLVMGVLSLGANLLLPVIWRAVAFTPPAAYLDGLPPLWLTVVNLTLNILGEELWWRGYILPRQELAHGRWAWLVHGVLWALFHLYKWWAVPAMLVTCLVIPFIAQRLKNTWPGVFIHAAINGIGVLLSGV